MKKWAVYFLCAIAFANGVAATYFVILYLQVGINGKAYLSKSYSSKGDETPAYDESALAQKDLIPFPKIDNINFKAKFVEPIKNIVTDKIPPDIAKRTRAIKPVVVLKKFVRPLYREKSPLTG